MRRSAYFLIVMLYVMPPSTLADYDEDVLKAQKCHNNFGGIACIRWIERYDNAYVNRLKCGIRLDDQGLRRPVFGDFPYAYVGPGRRHWAIVLNSISHKSTTYSDASRTRYDCQHAGDPGHERAWFGLFGEYVWLRYLILELTDIHEERLTRIIPRIDDIHTIIGLDESIGRLVQLCVQLTDDNLFRRTALCSEVDNLSKYLGNSWFDRFSYSLRF